MTETICQTSQTFAGRIYKPIQVKLEDSNVTQPPLATSDSTRGLSHSPHVCSPPTILPLLSSLVHRKHSNTGGRDTVSPAEAGYLSNSNFNKGVLLYLNTYIVPKNYEGQRPVINLKQLNRFVKSEHFKMEGLQSKFSSAGWPRWT